ncbi:MAG: hypothetical protein K1X88_01880 [Nannocystaceae bacterium]|jgi:uncharacterized membrane protein YiaA|nr:hypothetical protein [Nannocystaceae bacterium]
MTLLAVEAVDLLAFVGLGLSMLVGGSVVLGLGLWLRERARRPPQGGYYAGL